jgi:hypothetical protein
MDGKPMGDGVWFDELSDEERREYLREHPDSKLGAAKELVMIAKEMIGTGEMSRHDLQPGGEHYEWGQMLLRAARQLQRLTSGLVRVVELRPFDAYQGPYVLMRGSVGQMKLWSGDREGNFYLETPALRKVGKNIEGDVVSIADELVWQEQQ